MHAAEYQKMRQMEDRHWWFMGKRDLVGALIRRWANGALGLTSTGGGAQAVSRLLDVGCGTGRNLELLGGFGAAQGCDFDADAIAFCRGRGHDRLARASAERLPFASESMALVSLLDVLYHAGIRDDVAALREINRVLAPGGVLIFTDSAFQFLYGPHDRAVHARQRYTRGEVREKLQKAGFTVRRSGYFNCILFPLAAAVRLIDRWRDKGGVAHSSLSLPPPLLNRALHRILWLESRWLRRFNLPFGLSVYAVAEKPSRPDSADPL